MRGSTSNSINNESDPKNVLQSKFKIQSVKKWADINQDITNDVTNDEKKKFKNKQKKQKMKTPLNNRFQNLMSVELRCSDNFSNE